MAPMVEIKELGPTVIGVLWAETIFALPFVALRLFCRARLHKAGIGWDDAFMLASWLLFVAYIGACTAATRWGFGRHMDELEMVQFAEANKLEIVGQTMLIAAIATSKTSIAIFLLRIAVKKWRRLVLYASIVTLCIICFLCAALNFFQCNPIRHVWNPTVPAKCWMSVTPLAIATGAYSIFIDLLLAGLPWAIVWNLNMKKKEKMNIAISLSLGVFAAICGIVRTYELQGLSSASDYSYDTVSLVLWSASELLITIICANIPMLRPLFSKSAASTIEDTPRPHNSHPTIGSNRFGGSRKKGEETWTELDDDITMKSQLGAEKERGTNRASIAGGKNKFQDSDESILRESKADGIHVTEDIDVSAEGGRWSPALPPVKHGRHHAF